jgi:hypothetical protein
MNYHSEFGQEFLVPTQRFPVRYVEIFVLDIFFSRRNVSRSALGWGVVWCPILPPTATSTPPYCGGVEEGEGLQSRPTSPAPITQAEKKVFFFFSEPASSTLNGHLILVNGNG